MKTFNTGLLHDTDGPRIGIRLFRHCCPRYQRSRLILRYSDTALIMLKHGGKSTQPILITSWGKLGRHL